VRPETTGRGEQRGGPRVGACSAAAASGEKCPWPAQGRRKLVVDAGEGGRRWNGLRDVGGCRRVTGRQARADGCSTAWDGAGLPEASGSSTGRLGFTAEASRRRKKIKGNENG
jgi:hypothetical protein